MWRPLSRALEILGRLRIRLPVLFRHDLRVGHPSALDGQGSQHWRRFVSGEALYDVWGPLPESPWAPFHCIPIFAALDRIKKDRIGPPPPPGMLTNGDKLPSRWEMIVPEHAAPGAAAPPWHAPDVLTIVDLPGPASVEAAAWLVTATGCQPVCTFNNWPHPKGLLHPQFILAELLRWASAVAEARRSFTPVSPPVWICDSERLGPRSGVPGEFDNRYFIEDAILPGPGLLKSAGIRRIVYVTHEPAKAPVVDLDGFFFDVESAGIPVEIADVMEPWRKLQPWITKPPRKFTSDFRRSSAGGFGTTIPEPSSGGGG